jgi:hypothetical protein
MFIGWECMRLTRNQVEFISHRIMKDLIERGYIEADDPTKLREEFNQIITNELLIEDKLNDEVREILSQHAEEMRRTNVEYREMFKMIKKKLARERKIIL